MASINSKLINEIMNTVDKYNHEQYFEDIMVIVLYIIVNNTMQHAVNIYITYTYTLHILAKTFLTSDQVELLKYVKSKMT